MRLFAYGNCGGIGRVIKDIELIENSDINNNHKDVPETFSSIREVFNYIISEFEGDILSMDNLYLKYYGPDKRINHNVYMVVTDNYNGKQEVPPVFLKYVIDLDETLGEFILSN